ncbi:hypothetical protein FHS81_003040 [Pseudochelatococcus contaminans]|uniref:Uncharacterized protein n=1 Tax=Pseudochelatococcus contaminans TaxID=1538103 RepID=A0A7W5Z6V2_9HYPH|nr:hypothetical protein [Pseudochelatococcus contaminans]
MRCRATTPVGREAKALSASIADRTFFVEISFSRCSSTVFS